MVTISSIYLRLVGASLLLMAPQAFAQPPPAPAAPASAVAPAAAAPAPAAVRVAAVGLSPQNAGRMKRCEKGKGKACLAVAMSHLHGDGAPQDIGAANRLFRRGCDLKVYAACFELGLSELRAAGKKKPTAAVALFRSACAGEDGRACMLLAELVKHGEAGPKDPAEAKSLTVRGIALLGRACEAGLPKHCMGLAFTYKRGSGVPADFAKATPPLRRACNLGEGEACYQLSEAHEYGRGAPTDKGKSHDYRIKACDRGHGEACYALSQTYRIGTGGRKADVPRGLRYLSKACDLDSGVACRILGERHHRGEEVEKDFTLALTYYEKACNAGHYLVCSDIARFYKKGVGTELKPDPAKSKRYSDMACEANPRCRLP
ncbi:MAG: TPR repeat protein [Myxococcota bacterium]|jgi:TPR repeat protein